MCLYGEWVVGFGYILGLRDVREVYRVAGVSAPRRLGSTCVIFGNATSMHSEYRW